MVLFFLFAALVILCVFLLCITLVPIDLTVTSQNTAACSRHAVEVEWGPAGLQWTAGEDGIFWEVLALKHTVLRRRRKAEGRKGTERPPRVPQPAAGVKLPDLRAVPIFLEVARAVWRQASLRCISIRVRGGFSDPAQTGMVFGYVSALRGALYPWQTISIDMEPLFDGAGIEWNATLGMRIRHPSLLLPPGLRLAWWLART